MKITIPQANIARSGVQQVNVGEVKIGAVKIDQLTLNNVHVQSSTGIAEMRNVNVALTRRAPESEKHKRTRPFGTLDAI